MDGYLSKPVKLDDLVALVGEVAAKTMDARQPSPSAG